MKLLRTLIALALVVGALPLTAFATTPVASSFSTTVAANRQNAVQLQGTDAEGTSLTYATTSTPSHGTLSNLSSATGVVIYTPADNYVGADSFTYTVTSGGETSAAGTVTLAVTNAKTRIIDTIDPSVATGATAITFILTEGGTSPGGLIPKGASVSASVNSLGQFDISVYPSRSLSPAAYYQVLLKTSNLGQVDMGLYDIPLSTTTTTLSPYKVTDTNLAKRYSFASQAAVAALSSSISGAVYASMTSGNVTTALGYTPLRPSNNLSDLSNPGLARSNLQLGNVDNTSDAAKNSAMATLTNKTFVSPAVTGGLTVSGTSNFSNGLNVLTGNLNVNNDINVGATITAQSVAAGAVNASNLNLAAAIQAMLEGGQLAYAPGIVQSPAFFLDATKISATDGATITTWTDLSGAGRHAAQATESAKLTYHAADERDGLPYLAGSGTMQTMSLPIPATATKTIFVLARDTTPFPTGSLIRFNGINSQVGAYLSRWHYFKLLDGQGTPVAGYSTEYSVLCFVQNSANSISLYIDGVLAGTGVPEDPMGATTTLTIGPGPGRLRMLVGFDRAFPAADVAAHSRAIKATATNNYEFTYLDANVGGLVTPALVVSKRGFTGTRRLVILNHAAGFTERMFHDLPDFRKLLVALVDQGYIVAASRLTDDPASGYNSWGNQPSLDANAALYAYLSANFPIDTTKVAMIGDSMGGLISLLSFPDGRIPVKCAALYYPVTNLANVYANGFQVGIDTAYNIPGGGNYATQTAGHDPNLRAASDWTGKRLRFYGGPGDTVVNWTNNAALFSTKVSGTATEYGIVSLSGDHNGNVETTTSDLLSFMGRCGS